MGALRHSEAAVRPTHDPWLTSSGAARARTSAITTDPSWTCQSINLGWDDPVLFTARGDALMKAGGREREQAAFHDADLAVRLNPKQAGAYLLRSVSGLTLGRPAEAALADLKTAAELEPDGYRAFYDQQRPGLEKMIAAQRAVAQKVALTAAAKPPGQPRTGPTQPTGSLALGSDVAKPKRGAFGHGGNWAGLAAAAGLGLSLLAFAAIGMARKT